MTPEEFKNRMQKIKDDNITDDETLHTEMESLMCELLISLGYSEGVAIFETQHRY